VFDEGSGTPIVVVQGLQGRWEWTGQLVRELARGARTVTYSLCPQPRIEPYVAQLSEVMDAAGLRSAALCGISFGGAVAARYASEFPERVTKLVIVSSPGPGWKANAVQASYVARPWRSLPAFAVGALNRTAPEIFSALDTWTSRVGILVRYGFLAIRYPSLPHLLAGRVKLLEGLDLAHDCARITAPTLVVTGEPGLDRVVPVESTRRYAELIKGARYVMVEKTGHQGVLTQPRRFAALVNEFINGHDS
jgi:pimeloyl-ACP methyl ester carboxylesterase